MRYGAKGSMGTALRTFWVLASGVLRDRRTEALRARVTRAGRSVSGTRVSTPSTWPDLLIRNTTARSLRGNVTSSGVTPTGLPALSCRTVAPGGSELIEIFTDREGAAGAEAPAVV